MSQFTLIARTIGCRTFEPAKIDGIISEMRLGVQWSGEAKLGGLAWRNPITGISCCARSERPRGGRAAEQRDELAASHSITSSASANSLSGTVTASALAVLRLSTNSNLVGCMTGRSAGFSPLRTRPT